MNGKRIDEKDKSLICELYKRGNKASDIADIIGCSCATVHLIRREAGIPAQNPILSEAAINQWKNKRTIIASLDEDNKVNIRMCDDTVLDYIKCMNAKELAELFDLCKHYWFTQGRLSKFNKEHFNVDYGVDNVDKPFYLFSEEMLSCSLDVLPKLIDFTNSDIEKMKQVIYDKGEE